ncbi:MAG: hypothetical protein K2Y37_26455 [Pirellulales bacterium]|nr:hypothetical protein [Pirellulales bacterium]
MPASTISRDEFLADRQGRTFADVANAPNIPFDELLAFFADEGRQRRMFEAELHHDRAPLAGVVRELETHSAFNKFLSTVHHRRTQRFRQAVGVIIRMIMTRNGWRRTGRKGSLGIRAAVNLKLPAHNKGGLAFWFVRAERYELATGMPYRSVQARRRALEKRSAARLSAEARRAAKDGSARNGKAASQTKPLKETP